jgi:hypothetical protein
VHNIVADGARTGVRVLVVTGIGHPIRAEVVLVWIRADTADASVVR